MTMEDTLNESTQGKEAPPLPGDTWRALGIADTIHGVYDGSIQRPKPTIGLIGESGMGLFYAGKVHVLHGESGGGKSMLAAYVEAEQLAAGQHVIHIDYEDNPQTLIERLQVMGVDEARLVTHLHYIQPQEHSALGIHHIEALLEQTQATLVILDSTGESMGLDLVLSNEDGPVANWLRRVARNLAAKGAAVVLIDHVPKADANALMPIGSQRKSAGIDGAIFSLQEAMPFSEGKSGYAKVKAGKDRNGGHTKGKVAAEFHYTVGKGFKLKAMVGLATGPDGILRRTGIMHAISSWLAFSPGSSTKAIKEGVTGNDKAIVESIQALINDGYVKVEPGPHAAKRHFNIKPYVIPREDDSEGLFDD